MSNFSSFIRTSACVLALAGAFSLHAEENSLDIQVTDISDRDAKIEINTTPSNLTFYRKCLTKVDFEAAGGVDKVVDNFIAYCQGLANMYGDPSWKSELPYVLYSYPEEVSLSNWLDVLYDEDYVIYAFGMDMQGNVTVPVVTKEFHTTGTPVASDMTFDIKVSAAEFNGMFYSATATVTPSNSDKYIVDYYMKEVLDKYDFQTAYGEKSFACLELLRYLKPESLRSGTYELEMDRLREDTEYGIVVMGVDENDLPSTPISIRYFKTTDSGDEPGPGDEPGDDVEGSFEITISDVTYNDAYMEIIPTPDTLRYYWNFTTKTELEKAGGVDNVIDNCIEQWNKMAQGDYYAPDWISMLPYVLFEGAQYENLGEWKDMLYDEDYVLYAFAMDLEGNLTAPVTTREFHTLGVTPSDNSFEVTATTIQNSGYYLTATAHIVPSNNDTYMGRIYPKTTLDRYDIAPGNFDEKKFACEQMLYQLKPSEILTGEGDVKNDRCVEGEEYAIVVMGLDANNMPSTTLDIVYFTAVVEKPELGTLTLEVEDITPMNAHIKITPSSNEFRYYYNITTPDIVEKFGGVENIPEKMIIDWWKFVADLYQLDDWRECIEFQTTSGPLDSMVAELVEEGEISEIYWDEDYVLYAAGFNDNGDVVTEPAVLYFTTPKVEDESDMTFKFRIVDSKLDSRYPNSGNMKYYEVTIEVDPSNDDDHYRFKNAQTKYYDQYLEDEPGWLKEYLTRQFLPGSMEVSGLAHFVCEGVQGLDYYGEQLEYYASTIGWNEGPTTDYYQFKYSPALEAEKIEATKAIADGIKLTIKNGKIYLTGNFNHAVIYSTDGRVMGACQPGKAVAVPAGIYIVEYVNANGVTATKKVLVRE